VEDEVFVYAPEGEELQAFCNFIRDFNAREKDPTRWKLTIYRGEDPLEALIREKKADIVILAGKNDTKIKNIEALNRAGFMIFADKPWLTDEKNLKYLRDAMGPDRPMTMDIMTERFEITTILQKIFLAEPDVFGAPAIDPQGRPTIYKESVHHLLKVVNGKILRRPPWYFDVNTQGEGIVDVTTHLVDMTHWMLFPGEKLDFAKDIDIKAARRWATPVSLDKFALITRHDEFPPGAKQWVKRPAPPDSGEELSLFCNGDILYTLRGIPVHIRVVWNVEFPVGGGDTHYSLIRGTKADLSVRQLPERNYTPEFVITPHSDPLAFFKPIRAVLEKHAKDLPGLSIQRDKNDYVIQVPKELSTTHEQHFGEVRGAFLDMLAKGNAGLPGAEPAEMRNNIVTKYTLLVEAKKKAMASPFEPL
jgi:predicted dehydrogenase